MEESEYFKFIKLNQGHIDVLKNEGFTNKEAIKFVYNNLMNKMRHDEVLDCLKTLNGILNTIGAAIPQNN